MIETETIWEDSGFDCDHCGGVIAKRIDRESGQPDRTCLQCKQCGCQWTLAGNVERVGNGPDCQAAQRDREAAPARITLSRPIWIAIGIIAFFVLLRFGGFSLLFVLLRFLVPLALVGLVLYFIARHGREQQWW